MASSFGSLGTMHETPRGLLTHPAPALSGDLLLRLREIAAAALRHGVWPLAQLIYTLARGGEQGHKRAAHSLQTPFTLKRPHQLRLLLESLGPLFVKLGQMLAMRSDLLAPGVIRELRQLQHQTRALPFATIRTQIEESLGQPLEQLYRHFEEMPAAAASVAQVHWATLHSGESVAVKVLRPDVKKSLTRDLQLLTYCAHQLGQLGIAQAQTWQALLQELSASLLRETDFIHERLTMAQAAQLPAPGIVIPRSFAALSSAQVLTMERMQGQTLSEALSQQTPAEPLSEARRTQIAMQVLEFSLRNLMHHGALHCDLHGGNLYLLEDGRIAILDFGMALQLQEPEKQQLVQLMQSILQRDHTAIAQALRTMATQKIATQGIASDAAAFERACQQLTARAMAQHPAHIGALLQALHLSALQHGLRLPSELALAFKALITTEWFIHTLSPQLDIWAHTLRIAHALQQEDSPASEQNMWREPWLLLSAVLALAKQRLSAMSEKGLTLNIQALEHYTQLKAHHFRMTHLLWLLTLWSLLSVATLALPSPFLLFRGWPWASLLCAGLGLVTLLKVIREARTQGRKKP